MSFSHFVNMWPLIHHMPSTLININHQRIQFTEKSMHIQFHFKAFLNIMLLFDIFETIMDRLKNLILIL